ncbi:MAG TPA: helix-turn-helix domain-containing protein [Polyangia bacterium]|jgi:hypothetical protein|nr:helix-turn-helix domain-containing protein [Polyangia bacterium]
MDKQNNTGPGMTAPVEQEALSGSNNPFSTVDDDLDVEDQELLEDLRPFVVTIVEDMLAVRGKKSLAEMARWQRLAHAVRREMVRRGDVDAAIERIVGQKLGERIASEVEAFMRHRWTEEMRTMQLLVALGAVYLSTKRAAEIADCSERTINRALKLGELPTYYAGSDRRIKLGDLRKYLARRQPVEPDGTVGNDAGGVEPDDDGDDDDDDANRETESSGEHAR